MKPVKLKYNHQFKVGDKVRDLWYSEWGVGVVEEVLKTRIRVSGFTCYEDGYGRVVPYTTYDSGHYQFLTLV